MFSDLRSACRALAATPGVTLSAVLTLALGIGANTAIFTVVYGVLLKPLPYGQPDRLVRISETKEGLPWNVAYPNYLDWRARSHALKEMAIFSTFGGVVMHDGTAPAEIVSSGSAESSMFAVMGVPAAHGRLFAPGEDQPAAPAVALITDEFWRRHFGANPAAIGGAVTMSGDPVTVIGVLPPDVRPFNVDVWFPLKPALFSAMQLDRANHPGFGVVGRLADGVDLSAARRELSDVAASLAAQYPASNRDMGIRMVPMIESVAGAIRPTLVMLMCAVAVLLLIACANVANLLLAKGLGRERETSIRSALGASRRRLVRLFLIEGVVLGLAGAAAGVLLAGWGVRLIRHVPGLTLPRPADVAIDPHVLLFGAGLGIVTALVFALTPARHLSRVDLMRVLRLASGADTSSPRAARLRSLLVSAEVALLVVLLAGAALMDRSLANLAAVDVGIDAGHLLAAPLRQPEAYSTPGAASQFADRIVEALTANHAVAGAAVCWPFDYTGFAWAPSIDLPDHPFEPGREPSVQAASVTPGYFATMGIRLMRGRIFRDADRPGGPVALIVNQTFAARFFPHQEPIGRLVNAMRIPAMQNMPIVGVVSDTRRGGVLQGVTPEIYVAYAQFPQTGSTVVVRSAVGDPLALSPAIRSAISAIDPSVAVATMRRVSDALAQTYGDRRALSWLLGVFAVLALALTIIGIASVVSFTVAQRTREIGVRMALGADRGEVVRLIVIAAMAPVALGAAAGAAALIPLARLLHTYLFGITAADPAALAGSGAILFLAAVSAAYIPARRAASIDPLIALRLG